MPTEDATKAALDAARETRNTLQGLVEEKTLQKVAHSFCIHVSALNPCGRLHNIT